MDCFRVPGKMKTGRVTLKPINYSCKHMAIAYVQGFRGMWYNHLRSHVVCKLVGTHFGKQ